MALRDEMAASGIDVQSVEDGQRLIHAFSQLKSAAKRQEVISLAQSLVEAEHHNELMAGLDNILAGDE